MLTSPNGLTSQVTRLAVFAVSNYAVLCIATMEVLLLGWWCRSGTGRRSLPLWGGTQPRPALLWPKFRARISPPSPSLSISLSISIYLSSSIYLSRTIYMSISISLYIYVSIYIYLAISIYIYLSVVMVCYGQTTAYIYIYIYVYEYIYIHIYVM